MVAYIVKIQYLKLKKTMVYKCKKGIEQISKHNSNLRDTTIQSKPHSSSQLVRESFPEEKSLQLFAE